MVSGFYDAVIIGGGPAGAFAAAALARLGWRVMVVDRRAGGIGKACGHCLSERALPLLARAGLLDEVASAASGVTRACTIHLPSFRGGRPGSGRSRMPAPIRLSLNGGDSRKGGMVVRREALDALLLEHAATAGAEIEQPASATPWRIGRREVTVEIRRGRSASPPKRIRCGLLIGADGLNSRVARAAGIRHAVRSDGRGVSWRIPGIQIEGHAPGDISMFIFHGGYIGVVSETDGTVHVGALIHQGKCSARTPEAIVQAAREAHPRLNALAEQIRRRGVEAIHAAGPMPWRPRRISSGRVILLGDAAGFVEPFTGEGITWALESANILCCAATERGTGNTDEIAQFCMHRFAREITPAHRRCAVVSMAIAHPRLLAAASAPHALRDRLVQHFATRLAAPELGAAA